MAGWDDNAPWVDAEAWEHGDVIIEPPTAPGGILTDGNYQFEIEDFVFGLGAPVFVTEDGFDPGTAEWRTQDGQVAHGDGMTFGRDYLSAPTWAWTMGVDRTNDGQAFSEIARAKKIWHGNRARRSPGAVMRLKYRVAGRERHVYGRPRNFAVEFDNRILSGYAGITADFQCADHLTYDSAEEVISVPLIAPYTGGLRAPLKSPLRSVRPTVSERAGSALVGGDADTWPVISLTGPMNSGAVLEAVGQWRLETAAPLASGETLVIDSRPWVRTILRNGAGSPGHLGRRSRLSDLSLAPGPVQFTLSGSSSTGAASMTVRWHNASHSL